LDNVKTGIIGGSGLYDMADVTDRKAAEDHAQFLMHELSHRSKNLLAVIQSISRRTARTTSTMEEFESRFGRRLQGLAASHDVLVRNSWQGAPLGDLLRQQLLDLADRVCDGTATPLVHALVSGHQFTAKEINELRQLVAQLDTDAPQSPSKKRSK
jgi:hypothetical protein